MLPDAFVEPAHLQPAVQYSHVLHSLAIVAHGCSGNHRDVNNALRGIMFLPAFLVSLIG
jgi:hypothetical protein